MMKTQKLGFTNVEVSALCLGTMYFGTQVDRVASFRVLDQYIDAGGSFLDTANGYAHWIEGGQSGASETLLGEWLRERGNRSNVFIASKVGFDYPGVESGLSAARIEEECNKSLKRMGIETIDLIHPQKTKVHVPLHCMRWYGL